MKDLYAYWANNSLIGVPVLRLEDHNGNEIATLYPDEVRAVVKAAQENPEFTES